jgi:non-ribosomal peptide synthetase component F
MCSLVHSGTLSKNDVIIQMARCSFDVHIEEIMGTLIIGATLIMLHPGGTIDFDYLSTVLRKKQITCMTSVPSLYRRFLAFVEEYNSGNAMEYLKSVCSGGMYLPNVIVCF